MSSELTIILAHLPLDQLAMQLLFCAAHFQPLACFLSACHPRQLEFVASRCPPLLPSLDLPLYFDLPLAVALPRVLTCLLSRPALTCWLVVCLVVVPALVDAL